MAEINSSLALVYSVLKDSVHDNKIENLQRLLDCGLDVNHEYPDGSTLLHYACRSNQEETIRKLLKKGADVNKRDKEGHTALKCVTCKSYKKTLKLFFSLDNTELFDECTALDNVKKFTEFLNDLNENNAKVINKLSELDDYNLDIILNIRDKDGNSILLNAFAKNHEQIPYDLMDLVTKKGATIYHQDHLEKIKSGLSEMVGGFDNIGFHMEKNRYFSIISYNNNLNILIAFLTVIERSLQQGYSTLLIKACRENSVENVKEIIIRARDILNKNVCKEGMLDDLIIALKKESEYPNNYHFKKLESLVLHFASWYALRKHVIDIETVNGSTPLRIAVKNNNLDLIKLLLKHGAHINWRYEATSKECKDFFDAIISYCSSNGTKINNLNLKSDKLILANVTSCYVGSRPINDPCPTWLNYVGQPDKRQILEVLYLTDIEEVIVKQKFIL